MSSFFILARKQRYQVFSEQTNDSFAKSYLLTANPPINLYLRDSHCAIAHKPRWATFSAYSYNKLAYNILVTMDFLTCYMIALFELYIWQGEKGGAYVIMKKRHTISTLTNFLPTCFLHFLKCQKTQDLLSAFYPFK